MLIKRGEIHWIKKPMTNRGAEMQKARPAVIVSNNKLNDTSECLEVVYMTSQPKHRAPTHVTITKTSNGQGEGSTVLCEGIYTISRQRLADEDSYMARVSDEDMEAIDEALMFGLGIDTYEYEAPKEKVEGKYFEELESARMCAEFYKKKYEYLLERIMQKANI